MLNRILPQRVDNTFHGHKLALWLFVPIVLAEMAMSLNSIFNGYFVAQSADKIPLSTFTSGGAATVVSLFALLGLSQLMLCLLCVLVLIRYRALIAFMYVLLLLEYIGRRWILFVKPIVRTGTPLGTPISLAFMAMVIIGLVLSLRSRSDLRIQE